MVKRGVSKTQWLEEALEVLANEGVVAVKVDHLAKRLGIARSGFYWHFKDRRDLLDHMLDYWTEEFTDVATRNPEILTGPPAERLLNLARMVEEYALMQYDIAMFAWAARDDRVKSAVDSVYARRLEFVGAIFAELGFTGAELDLRTRMFVCYTSLAPVMPDQPNDRRIRVDLLTAT